MASNPAEQIVAMAQSGGLVARPAGPATRKARDLDVRLIKAAVDFQNLTREDAEPVVRQNLEALREGLGLDAMFIATFDEARTCIEGVLAAPGLFAAFNPWVALVALAFMLRARPVRRLQSRDLERRVARRPALPARTADAQSHRGDP